MGFYVAAQARVTGPRGLYGQGGDAVRVQALFMDGDLAATLRAQRDRALRAVDEITESAFRSEDPNGVVARLYEQFRIEPIALTEGAISVEAHYADVDLRRLRDIARDVDRGVRGAPSASSTLRGTRVIYNVPYTGEQVLFQLRPSTWTLVVPRAALNSSELRFVYEVRSSEVAATKRSFERDLSLIKRWLGWVNDDIVRFNEELAAALERAVAERNARLAEVSEGLAALGLPVRTADPASTADAASTEGSARTEDSAQTDGSARTSDPSRMESLARTACPDRKAGRFARSPTRRRTDSDDQLGTGMPTATNCRADLYDVALSFAGEDRSYVEKVAACLKEAGVRVFYDKFESADLWGKDLVAHLQDVYQNRARYCVLFISKHYANKPWPRHERRSAQARALVADQEYLLPARFDDTVLPGLPPTIGFVDLRDMDPADLAKLILGKLGMATT